MSSVPSSSSFASNSATSDREKKYNQLKKKIAWAICTDLLNPSLPAIEPLRFTKDDSPEEKQMKRIEHAKRVEEREAERITREPELLSELDRVIERVKNARADYERAGMSYTAIAESQKSVKIYCERCKNQDPANTVTDNKTGDRICLGRTINAGDRPLGCGQVLLDHSVNSGAAKRTFEGEEDKNHFGPSPNILMSDAWNMSTSISVNKSGREDSTFKKILQTAQIVEMDLSNIGSNEHRTREGYKNRQKREAFEMIENIGDNCGVHQVVRDKAKEEFSKYRDLREAIQQYNAVVAACLLLSYQELSLNRDVDVKSKVYLGPRLADESPKVEFVPDPSDPAEASVSDVPVAKWDIDQTKTWLLAVSGGVYDSFAQAIISHLDSNTSKPTRVGAISVKIPNKYDVSESSFLGTTTIAGRNKVASQNKIQLTIGKQLVQLKLSSIAHNSTICNRNDAEKHFSDALRRRSQFEIRRRDAQENAAKEAIRLAHESSGLLSHVKEEIVEKVKARVDSKDQSEADGIELQSITPTPTSEIDSVSLPASSSIAQKNGMDGSNIKIQSKSAAAPPTTSQTALLDFNELFGGSVTFKTVVAKPPPTPATAPAPTAATHSLVNGSSKQVTTTGRTSLLPVKTAINSPSVFASSQSPVQPSIASINTSSSALKMEPNTAVVSAVQDSTNSQPPAKKVKKMKFAIVE